MNRYWSVVFLVLLFFVVCDQLALKRLNQFAQLQGQIADDYWSRLKSCEDKKERATDFVESLARCGFMNLKPEMCGMTPEKVNELLKENRDG